MYKRKESPQYINNAEGKMRLFDAVVLNEARIICTSVERSVYCKGARAWNSLPPTEKNLPCHEAFNPFAPADAWRHSLARHAMCLQALPHGARHVLPGTQTYMSKYRKNVKKVENDILYTGSMSC